MARSHKIHRSPTYPKIKEVLRDINDSDIPPALIPRPPNSESSKLSCSCGNIYEPPWAQKLEFEWAPAQSLDGVIYSLAGIPLACPACNKLNLLTFPKPAFESSHATLYGDETSESVGIDYFSMPIVLYAL
jgi:hypothetical protein